jgi:CheY-like chemotaxis protein
MAATLLLADDSPTIQRLIELTFAQAGVRVVTVRDGEAVFERLGQERPGIVLADVGMPGVDGYRIAEHVRQTPELRDVPVLLLAGAFEPVDEAKARASGCDGVLVKPLESATTVETVMALLQGRRPAGLWPQEMPRIDPVPKPFATAGHPPGAAPVRPASVTSSPIEAEFQSGLDDLDLAFSRLDPVAPASRLDAETASDFHRDILEFRSEPPDEPAPVAPPLDLGRPVTHLPVEDVTALDEEDLSWDLPAPSTVVDAIPLPASFPDAPPPVPATPATLSSAFSPLLAAEKAHPELRQSLPSASDALIEEVVQRVVSRLADEVVRRVTAESAATLIREELERIHSQR